MPRPLLRSQLVSPALAIVRESGADVEALLESFGLPASAETDAEFFVPVEVLRGLLDRAAEVSGEVDLGRRIASRYRRGMFGLLEFSWRAAATVRDACERIARHVPLISDLLEITFTENAGGGTLEERIAGEPLCVGRHANEFFATALLLQAREITGVPIVPERVYFAHPPPVDVEELVQTFGTTAIDFDRGANGLVLGEAVLSLPLPTADPPLLALIDRQAEVALATRPSRSSLLARVREIVREGLAGETPSLVSVARTLRSSPRSLQRSLREQGATFQQLIDSVREDLARAHVAAGTMPVASISYTLGYSDESAFLRAFRRWTGTTPAIFRKSLATRPPTSR